MNGECVGFQHFEKGCIKRYFYFHIFFTPYQCRIKIYNFIDPVDYRILFFASVRFHDVGSWSDLKEYRTDDGVKLI